MASEAEASEAEASKAEAETETETETEISETETEIDTETDTDTETEIDTDIEEDEKLDNSWIDNFKEEEYNYNDFYKEPIKAVMLFLLYINKDKELIYVDANRCLLNENGVLKRDRIIALVKHYQTRNFISYKLNAILRYNVDLDPEEITDFVNENTNDRFLTSEKYLNDIHYTDSINMFQDLNALYFIYYEDVAAERPATHGAEHQQQTKRIKLSTKQHKTMRNKHKKNLKIKKEIR